MVAVPELEIGAIARPPADPQEWAETVDATVDGAAPAGGGPTPPVIDQAQAEGAVRLVHHVLWSALRAESVSPLAEEDVAAIAEGLLPWAERVPILGRALREMSGLDPAKGFWRWADAERRAHAVILPPPVGSGERAPDGWWSRLVAWARARVASRRGVGAVDRGAGADGQ